MEDLTESFEHQMLQQMKKEAAEEDGAENSETTGAVMAALSKSQLHYDYSALTDSSDDTSTLKSPVGGPHLPLFRHYFNLIISRRLVHLHVSNFYV